MIEETTATIIELVNTNDEYGKLIWLKVEHLDGSVQMTGTKNEKEFKKQIKYSFSVKKLKLLKGKPIFIRLINGMITSFWNNKTQSWFKF